MLVLPENLKDILSKTVIEITGKYVDLNKHNIFYFGSRVTGKSNDRSDIDIGIMGKEPIEPVTIQKIEDELKKLPTLLKIEVVDFSRVSDDFKKVSLSIIEPIIMND